MAGNYATLQRTYQTKEAAYDVTFEPHTFHIYDRCAGQYEFKTKTYRQFTPDESKQCCKIVAKIMNIDDAFCNEKANYTL